MRRPLDYIVMESLACAIQHPVIRPGAKAPWHRFWMLRKNDRVVSMTWIPDYECLDGESSVTELPAWEIYSFLHIEDILEISLLTDSSTNFSTRFFFSLSHATFSFFSLTSSVSFPIFLLRFVYTIFPIFNLFIYIISVFFIIFFVILF